MIFVTGDTHGQHDFAKLRFFANEINIAGKDDYVIITGDFGAVWSEKTLEDDLKPYESLPFTVLFVDGNHENFDLLNSFPIEIWNGGKIHRIRNNIIHLMRGQVYEIEGKTFFTFGGATSIDKIYRTENISWWQEEVPSDKDMREAQGNLQKVNFKVDYIITHSCDERALYYPPLVGRTFQTDKYPENAILSEFEKKVEYKHWYFGHYHLDGDLTDRKTVLYNEIIELK
ncbi:MAG: metallophosphoesterase [Clostridia bacterium]|nr:metallophosphoesterase [Clostridia bacterium]